MWQSLWETGPSKICGRQLLTILKWYNLFEHITSNFLRTVFHKFCFLLGPFLNISSENVIRFMCIPFSYRYRAVKYSATKSIHFRIWWKQLPKKHTALALQNLSSKFFQFLFGKIHLCLRIYILFQIPCKIHLMSSKVFLKTLLKRWLLAK